MICFYQGSHTHTIHVWYIYLHENHKKSTIHVGEYTSPMDPFKPFVNLLTNLTSRSFVSRTEERFDAQEAAFQSGSPYPDAQWMVDFTYKIWLLLGAGYVGKYTGLRKYILLLHTVCIFADMCNIFVYIIISMYIQCTACTKYIYLNLHMTHSRLKE